MMILIQILLMYYGACYFIVGVKKKPFGRIKILTQMDKRLVLKKQSNSNQSIASIIVVTNEDRS